ncbi:MAG: type II secretion system F family protein [Candidatus Thermoplasmatota archaeon]|nr:type II secretion system F family protein [Candidatus Thermoplasmatota archaeon]
MVLLFSYFAALIFVVFYVLLNIRSGGTFHLNILIIAGIVAVLIMVPYGVMDSIDMRTFYEAERRVSDFLRDVAEYTTFGMPISQAIVRASQTDYGPLSKEVKRVAALISWGIPVEEALSEFGKESGSQNIIRAGKIVMKAAESGSNISDVMNMVSEFTSQMQLMRNSRFSEMKSYTMVMMIAFGVFLFVVLILDVDFLPKLDSGTSSTLYSLAVGGSQIATIKNVFNIGMIVQGGGTGIISGVLRDGRISSGILLSGILILVSMVVLLLVGAL